MLKLVFALVMMAPALASAAIDRTYGYDGGQCLAGPGNLGGGITCPILAGLPSGPLGLNFSMVIRENSPGNEEILSFSYEIDPAEVYGASRTITYNAADSLISAWSFDGTQFSITASSAAGSVNAIIGGGVNDAATCAAASDLLADCDWYAQLSGMGEFAGIRQGSGWQLVSEVPLPAAAWLFISALGLLGLGGRRRARARARAPACGG